MWIICHGEEGGVCTGAAGDSGRGVVVVLWETPGEEGWVGIGKSDKG